MASECRYSRNTIYESIEYSEATVFENTGGNIHYSMLDLEDGTYRFIIACNSAGVNETSEVVFSRGESISGLNMFMPETMTPGNTSAFQSENTSEPFTILNNGSEELEMDLTLESSCCRSWVRRDGEVVDRINIEPGSEKRYVLTVYPPLYAEEGIHEVLVQLEGPVSRQKSVSFQVSDNRELRRLAELKDRAETLRWRISNFDSAGIETGDMNQTYGELQESIRRANRSIQRDNMTGLKQATSDGFVKAESIDASLEDSRFMKYVLLNWWKWALGFVVTYFLFFVVTMLAIPYYRLKTQQLSVNRKLQSAVEARKKGEKQYFRREIDKETFNQMMRQRQNQVLELRGEKEDLDEEMDNFLSNQLTVENYIRAPAKAVDEVVKWWQANQEARESLNEDEE
jgi:hypothetical protein